jgi:hypothetical protein
MNIMATEREHIHTEISKKIMLVDGHSHAGFDATNFVRGRYPTVQSIPDMVRKMKASGVNYALSFPPPSDLVWFDLKKVAYDREWVFSENPGEDFPYQLSNKNHFKESDLFGEKLILPFAAILPGVKEDEQIAYLSTLAESDLLFGLKLHTLATHTHASTLERSRFIDFANRYSLPITLHCGSDEYSLPEQVVDLAEKFQNVRFCIAHSADFKISIYKRLKENPLNNLFIDTCPHITNCILAEKGPTSDVLDLHYANPLQTLIELYNILPSQIIWGTDEPWTTVSESNSSKVIAKVTYEDEVRLFMNLPKEIRTNMGYINSIRYIFGS